MPVIRCTANCGTTSSNATGLTTITARIQAEPHQKSTRLKSNSSTLLDPHGYDLLDQGIAKTLAKKESLLWVLKYLSCPQQQSAECWPETGPQKGHMLWSAYPGRLQPGHFMSWRIPPASWMSISMTICATVLPVPMPFPHWST